MECKRSRIISIPIEETRPDPPPLFPFSPYVHLNTLPEDKITNVSLAFQGTDERERERARWGNWNTLIEKRTGGGGGGAIGQAKAKEHRGGGGGGWPGIENGKGEPRKGMLVGAVVSVKWGKLQNNETTG